MHETAVLSAQHYTSPEIYALETERIMARGWLFAGHASQLRRAGDYFAFSAAGENGFCILGENGDIRAFYNVCQHRGHQLLTGEGNVRAIVCPYHSWSYGLDGNFRSAPNIAADKNFPRDSIRLCPMRAEVFCGFVFINMDENAAPMDEWFPEARREIMEFAPDIESRAPLLWVEIPEQCNWKVSVENYSECYHCALNHPTFSAGVIRPETYDIRPNGFCLRHSTKCQDVEKMSYPVDLSAGEHAGDYGSWFLWPLFSLQIYPGGMVNTYHWRPDGPEKVTVWRGWHTPDGEESETMRRLAQQDRDTTVAEDIRLVESAQRGLRSRGYRPGPLLIDPKGGVNSEHAVLKLRQWTRDALAD